MPESLGAEQLLKQMDELRIEHEAMERAPKDVEGHRAHRNRLRKQIDELHAHRQRLQQRPERHS